MVPNSRDSKFVKITMKLAHSIASVITVLVFTARTNAFDVVKTKAEPINGINGSVILSCQVDANYEWCQFKHRSKV